MTNETEATVQTDGNDTAAVLAAMEGDKTYLSDAQESEAAENVAEDDTTPGDDAAAATTEGEAQRPKAKQSVQERINELTAARREAERDRDFYREQALRNQPEATPAYEAQQIPQGDGRPNRADYDDDFAYIEDLTDWKAWAAADQMVQQQQHTSRISSVIETYHTRAKSLFPDGKPAGLTAFEQVVQVPETVNEILGTSEVGPLIAAHLGENPAELDRINGLTPFHQVRALTLLEARLTPNSGRQAFSKTATDAPEPPPTARGSNGQFKVAGDTSDFAAFEKQFRISG